MFEKEDVPEHHEARLVVQLQPDRPRQRTFRGARMLGDQLNYQVVPPHTLGGSLSGHAGAQTDAFAVLFGEADAESGQHFAGEAPEQRQHARYQQHANDDDVEQRQITLPEAWFKSITYPLSGVRSSPFVPPLPDGP